MGFKITSVMIKVLATGRNQRSQLKIPMEFQQVLRTIFQGLLQSFGAIVDFADVVVGNSNEFFVGLIDFL